MTTELIKVELAETFIGSTDEAMEIASNLHTSLTEIVVVNSPATQANATAIAVSAQGFLKRLEASRKDVKAPILAIGKKIDALADELAAPVKAEMNRVGQMVAKFQQAEAIRVEQERKEREKAEREAMDLARLAAEEARQAADKITTESDMTKAIEAEETAKQLEAEMYSTLTAPQPKAIKAEGSVVKKVLKYEVLDITAAFKAAPHLFKVEIKPSAVNSTCTKDTVIPGMRFWEEIGASFRST